MRILLLSIVLVLTACATQTHQPPNQVELSEAQKSAWVMQVQKWLRDRVRLESITSRIRTKGVEYCHAQDHVGAYLGFQLWSNQSLDSNLQKLAQDTFDLGSEPQISNIMPESPASAAGFKVRDKILTINGEAAHTVLDTMRKINEASTVSQLVSFTIRREGKQHTIVASPIIACKSQSALVDDDTIRTHTDGETIKITRGLLHFAKSDAELATIVSHQLAHNARKHHRTNKIWGGLGGFAASIPGAAADVALAVVTAGIFPVGVFTGAAWEAGQAMASSTSDSQFQQADRDSLQLMMMAGYETESALNFWQRVDAYNAPDNRNGLRNSHPLSQNRFSAMELAQKEVGAHSTAKIE